MMYVCSSMEEEAMTEWAWKVQPAAAAVGGSLARTHRFLERAVYVFAAQPLYISQQPSVGFLLPGHESVASLQPGCCSSDSAALLSTPRIGRRGRHWVRVFDRQRRPGPRGVSTASIK